MVIMIITSSIMIIIIHRVVGGDVLGADEAVRPDGELRVVGEEVDHGVVEEGPGHRPALVADQPVD